MAATSPETTFRPALRKGPRFDPSAARRPILVFEDVYKSYRADQPVLRGMSLVIDRDRLLDMVQGREAHLFDRAVDNQVSRLRRKVEADSRNPTLIQTVWGGGYMLAADVRRIKASA